MKNRVIIILLSVVSICACTENESFPSEATTVNAVLEGYTWHTGDMISLFDGGKNLLLTSFTEGEKACFEAETLPNKALVVFPGNKSYELTDMDLEVSFTAKPRVIPEEKLGKILTEIEYEVNRIYAEVESSVPRGEVHEMAEKLVILVNELRKKRGMDDLEWKE